MTEREGQWSAMMRAARAGDEAAYRRLLTEVAGELRALARRGLERAGQSTADAEDIVQETLIALHQKRHTWNPDQPLRPWLHAIARHKLVDALRRRRIRIVPIDDIADRFAADDPNPDFLIPDVVRMADRLPRGQRAVVLATVVDGCSGAEAARRLAMSEGAVRVALHRGLARLADLLNGRTR
ncbi:MAG TPA: sigma-70 family RNA polymerase sigma factor [Microvirga sp.]|nr:sigma-70 family RNA polymerase sigma factor [Microvirga sp.]